MAYFRRDVNYVMPQKLHALSYVIYCWRAVIVVARRHSLVFSYSARDLFYFFVISIVIIYVFAICKVCYYTTMSLLRRAFEKKKCDAVPLISPSLPKGYFCTVASNIGYS